LDLFLLRDRLHFFVDLDDAVRSYRSRPFTWLTNSVACLGSDIAEAGRDDSSMSGRQLELLDWFVVSWARSLWWWYRGFGLEWWGMEFKG
jgi:hypothetical protein